MIKEYNKDQFINRSNDLTLALKIQKEQNEILKQTKSDSLSVTFQDRIVVLKEALTANEIFLERSSEPKDGKIGWYMGLLNDKKSSHKISEYSSIFTYELLKYNPVILKVLSLSVGCLIVIKNKEVIEIVDKSNNKLL